MTTRLWMYCAFQVVKQSEFDSMYVGVYRFQWCCRRTCCSPPPSLCVRYYSHSLPMDYQLNVFAHIDTNKDVHLSFVEMQAYFAAIQASNPDLADIDPSEEARRVGSADHGPSVVAVPHRCSG